MRRLPLALPLDAVLLCRPTWSVVCRDPDLPTTVCVKGALR